jgi:3-phenylpropionate/trans-cinnamate dioxygenase ferredoxin reductase subunit
MMPKTFNVSIGNQVFSVNAGVRLLHAALQNGVDLPHDCRAGQCGACAVELTKGITLGGELGCGNVLACQARVFSDLVIAPHDAPEPVLRNAVVKEVRTLTEGIVKLVVRPQQAIEWRPGQYMKLQFNGYPARSFSPTARLSNGEFDDCLVFHIKQVRDGLVTPRLGGRIGVGAKLKVEGPFGHAFLRNDVNGRIVLLGSGTGFAPIWAIAAAAQKDKPGRPMAIICGAKNVRALYMGDALLAANRFAGASVKIVLEKPHPGMAKILMGTPADHMPALTENDIVFAAGGPRMVEQARTQAQSAGARFYADPFTTAAPVPFRAANGLRRMAELLRFGSR